MSGPEFNVYRHGVYHMTTASDATSFIVWREADSHSVRVGMIFRPREMSRDGWGAYDLNGHKLGVGIGPRTALARFTRRDREQ